jgi:pimeloyl-ACP methyl ester carboxylesterase
LYVLETGPRDAPAVLFLHPLGLDHTYWQPAQELLQSSLVLAPDLPGFGRSRREPAGLDSAVEACACTLADCGAKAVVVGISYGGYVAALLAARHPEQVAGLAFSGVRRRVPGSLASVQALLFRGVRTRDLARGDETVTDSERATEKRNLVASSQELGRVDLGPTLPGITAPTVVFAPEKDRFVRGDVTHVAAAIPDARVVAIPGAPHLWAQQEPELLATVVGELLPHQTAS